MNKEAFLKGFLKAAALSKVSLSPEDLVGPAALALLGAGTLALSRSPHGKAKPRKPISVPLAALTGILAPAGPSIHGALVDRRNHSGGMNAKGSPSARENLLFGSMGGGLLGLLGGAGIGSLFNDSRAGPAVGGILGMVGGAAGGGAFGAQRYNTKMNFK